MKKITLLFVGVLASAFTFAGDPEDPKSASGMEVVKRDDNSFKVIYRSEEESDVKIEVYNSQKSLVYHDTIKNSNGFTRPYSLTGFLDGEYTIRLDNGSNWMTKTISMAKPEKLAHLINLKDGKYLLTVSGKGEDEIYVRVSNEQGETIHAETTPVYGDFAQIFDMSGVKGGFTFEVSDKNGLTKTLTK
ncbi:MAG TPA: DUF3244 domain-containing protein [Cyclobacteriaceae bacterium]|nr:DUF3244 domain-containing protein [Cyclobacteriaceae bacterium]